MQNELVSLIDTNARGEGVSSTAVPGLHLGRYSTPQTPYHGVLGPSLAVVGQGSKSLLSGQHKFLYDCRHYIVATHELPLTIGVTKATQTKPYLGLRYELDLSQISLVDRIVSNKRTTIASSGVFLSPMTGDLHDAVVRLLRLLKRPADIDVMSPLLHREILFRILQGEHGEQMRALANSTSRSSRVAAAIAWLKTNYIKRFSMKKMAVVANMSASGLHAHFKAITGMTPLEFQKHLRLHEARRLMLSSSINASTAAYEVGYLSASQFNREFKRLFGETPGREVRLRS